MTRVALRVNGAAVRAEIEARTHLADFLREHLLLTGTHLGCEHGICGACTMLLDDAPVRGCITFAVLCADREVRSIEGLQDDPTIAALRAAFTAEHALQCSYCTPGMLITARDIVLRLPGADDDRVRLELAGNLCRCTGYNGIVRAIRRVLDDPPVLLNAAPAPLPAGRFEAGTAASPATARPASASGGGNRMAQTLRFDVPAAEVWGAVQNPALIASCVSGAVLLSVEAGRITGEMRAALGPIAARFSGEAELRLDPEARSGRLVGAGRDQASGTRLSAEVDFRVTEDGARTSAIVLDIAYALRGPLAQFGRGPIVRVFAAELAAGVARTLQARLRGTDVAAVTVRLGLGRMVWRIVLRVLGRPQGG